jgi:hypothetical protein
MCPLYFILADGVCLPLFSKLHNVHYLILLQADIVSASGYFHDGEIEVALLTRGLDDILIEKLGNALIKFSIWKDENSPLKRQFFVTITVADDFDNGRYINILKFMHDIIRHSHYINKDLQILFSFNSKVSINEAAYRFKLILSGFLTPLLISRTSKQVNTSEEMAMPLYISASFLCYRFILNRNEIIEDFGSLMSFYLKMKVSKVNYQVSKNGDYIMCLQNAISAMDIFSKPNSSHYKFISKTSGKIRNDISPKESKEKSATNDIDRSLVSIIATGAVLAFILIIRRVLKRRTVGQVDTNLVEFANDRSTQCTESFGLPLSGENETVFNGGDSAGAVVGQVDRDRQ